MISFSELKKQFKNHQISQYPTVKLAVLADSASQLFCQALKAWGVSQKINFDIWEADYDQIYSTVSDGESDLYKHNADYVVIFQSVKKLIYQFYKSGNDERQNFADSHIHFVQHICTQVNEKSKAKIIYLNFPEVDDKLFGNYANKTNQSFLFQLRQINIELMMLGQQYKEIHICDIASLQNEIGKRNLFSEQLYVTADTIYSLDALVHVAKNITDIVLAARGHLKKCVVLDLDNTLWGGIIGDDGLENIQLGSLGIGKAFTAFQKWLKELKNRGIILAVSSKNTEHIAREVFEKHPDMALRMDDIAVFAVNWDNKADNIRHIQSVLNIGFDSMVFFDDNPFERDMVQKHLPDVTVPDLPEDPAEYLSYICTLNLFETASLTADDAKRTKQYQEEAKRISIQKSFVNEGDFLASLNMLAEVSQMDSFILPRAAQLTQRSNQFNLRTVRYTDADLQRLQADPSVLTMAITLRDKFGDYGMISLVIGKITGNELFIDTWIMSCRVLKRGVEKFVLNELVRQAESRGATAIVGEYLPTAKNGLVKDHYQQLGFQYTNPYWKLDVNGFQPFETAIEVVSKLQLTT